MDETKKVKLLQLMEQYAGQDVAVAFSGGVDSALLLKLACDSARTAGSKVYAVTLHTALHPNHEIAAAGQMASAAGAEHIIIRADELQEAGITHNPVDRCYRCKKYLFGRIKEWAATKGIHIIIEGTNEDDLHVYRPGIQAVRELGILSPLAQAGIRKQQVRELAREYGIPAAARPSSPCLATRFPYGTLLSREAMDKIDRGEEFIRRLGFYNVRLRVHDNLVRIEVDRQDMPQLLELKDAVTGCLQELGYTYITLDLAGFRSGSMDENHHH